MPESPRADEVLNSWKEIACYLNRGVRTVQRWEADLALPVRRPRGKRRGAVIAMRADVNAWLNDCPLTAIEKELPEDSFNGAQEATPRDLRVQPPVSDLILQSRLLRGNVRRACEELNTAVHRLMGSMQKMSQTPGTRIVGANLTSLS